MESNFPFIISKGPKLQNDPQTRQIIRKQAMRDAGMARKRKGTFGKQNKGQFPNSRTDVSIRPSVSSTSRNSSSSSSTASLETWPSSTSACTKDVDDSEFDEFFDQQTKGTTAHAIRLSPMPTSNLLSSYETTRSKFSVDITDLSMLTNFNVGKSTIPALSADPSRLAALLDQQQWSYVEYIPSRYGNSQCLTAATDCVLAKVRSVLAPQSGHEQVQLRLYAKALHSLQKAISNGADDCSSPDVLCATQMLSLHELLDPSSDSAWSHHVNGSVRIVKHRGTHRFETDFEKALFAAHVGTVVSESLLANEDCYLAEPEWSTLYLSMVQDSDFLTVRSPLTLKIRHSMFVLPGLWHDIDALVTGPQLFDDEAVAELERRCRAVQSKLLSWTEEYKTHSVRLSLASPPPNEICMRRELFGTSLECLILAKRLLSTVCESERQRLEREAQALAHLIFDLQKQPSPKYSWLFTGHETGIAYTVAMSRDQWEEEPADTNIERKLATRNRYTTWNYTLRNTEGA